ncbi:hypothetical protein GQ53DRAFT_406972 [Thozetella sp. PMI_491]|nr:hypothetical protein GQ53DRAFT_406972 [Thozetella sp. PMI_491]
MSSCTSLWIGMWKELHPTLPSWMRFLCGAACSSPFVLLLIEEKGLSEKAAERQKGVALTCGIPTGEKEHWTGHMSFLAAYWLSLTLCAWVHTLSIYLVHLPSTSSSSWQLRQQSRPWRGLWFVRGGEHQAVADQRFMRPVSCGLGRPARPGQGRRMILQVSVSALAVPVVQYSAYTGPRLPGKKVPKETTKSRYLS